MGVNAAGHPVSRDAPLPADPLGTGAAARPAQSPEQLRYARWLERGARAGLALLLLCFFGYATGLVAPQVSLARLPEVWALPVDGYLHATGMPSGWGWLGMAGRGDVANLLGIAVLAGCSLPALLALVPIYAARGERVYVGVCVAEVVVLLLAASGLLTAGH